MAVELTEGAAIVTDVNLQQIGRVGAFLRHHAHAGIRDEVILLTAPDGQYQVLPSHLVEALQSLIQLLEQGSDVALVSIQRDLTTGEAAALLNVSPTFMARLLDDQTIATTGSGTQRRVRLQDLLAYRRQRDEKNRHLLDEVLSFAQEQGGYD